MRNLFGGDPHFNNVILHLPFQEHTRDVSPQRCIITQTGTGVYSGAQYRPPKLLDGRGAYYYDPVSHYLSATVPALGSGPWTIEFWAQSPGSGSGTGLCLDHRTADYDANGFALYFRSTGKIALGGGNPFTATESTLTWTTNTWYHISAVRRGDTIFVYVNGKLQITRSWSADLTSTTWKIGAQYNVSDTSEGYLADFRVTKGVARYTTEFTTPSFLCPTHGVSKLACRVPISLPEIKRQPILPRIKRFLSDPLKSIEYAPDPFFNNVSFYTPAKTNYFRDYSILGKGTPLVVEGSLTPSEHFTDINNLSAAIDIPGYAVTFPGDFTIEFWINLRDNTTAYRYIMSSSEYNSVGFYIIADGFYSGWGGDGNISFYCASGVTNGISLTSTTIIRGTGLWNHIAISKNYRTFRLFINGKLEDIETAVGDVSLNYSSVPKTGAANFTSSSDSMQIRDIRITKGVGRYTENFYSGRLWPADPPQRLGIYRQNGVLPATLVNVPIPMLSDAIRSPVSKNYNYTGDVYFNNVSLNMPLQASLRDESKSLRTVTVNGNTVIKNNAAYFDGNGDYLTIANSTGFQFGTEDWTIEAMVNFSSYFGYYSGYYTAALLSKYTSSSNREYSIYFGGTVSSIASIALSASSNGTSWNFCDFGGNYSFQLNTWYHVAVCRANSKVLLYVNGNLVNSASVTGSMYTGTASIRIGYFPEVSWEEYFPGYIKNLRVTKGIARYRSNFIPPIAIPLHGVDNSKNNIRGSFTKVVAPEASKKVIFLSAKDNLIKTDPFAKKVIYHIRSDTGRIYDLKGNTITNNSNYVTVDYNVKPFEKSSMKFITSDSYLTLPLINIWSENYTIDGYFYNLGGYGSAITSSSIVSEGQAGSCYWSLGIDSTNNLNLYVWTGSQVNISGGSIVTGKWLHFAMSYSNGICSVWIDGIRRINSSVSPVSANYGFNIGMAIGFSNSFNGYMKDIRVTKGLRYTGPIFYPDYTSVPII